MTRFLSHSLTHLLVAALVAIAAVDAHAADATITYPLPSTDATGISAVVGPGIAGCLTGCASLNVPPIAAVAAGRQGLLQFAAPAGSLVVGGTVQVRYRTKQAGVTVRLRQRFGTRWVDGTRLRSITARTGTMAISPGVSSVAVALATDTSIKARAISSAAENVVTVDSVSLIVRDLTAPSVAWTTGALSDDGWRRGVVCAAAAGQDVGLGVDRLELAVGAVVSAASAPAGTRLQPRPLAFGAQLCIDTTLLTDGAYGTSLSAVDTGATGNRSATVSGLMRIDNTAPAVRLVPVSDREERRPELELAVDERTSGITTLTMTVDGEAVPLLLTGTTAVGKTPRSLGDGPHRVAWEAVDAAGNSTSGSEVIAIADATSPTITDLTPVGVTTGQAAISATVADRSAGVAPDGIRLAVDGVDVTGLLDLVGDAVRYAPTVAWSPGAHAVRLTATDRSGNRSIQTWSFSVPSPPAPPLPPSPTDGGTTAQEPPAAAAPVSDGPAPAAPLVLKAPASVTATAAGLTLKIAATRGDEPAAGLKLDVRWRGGNQLTPAVVDASGTATITLRALRGGVLVITAGDATCSVRVNLAGAVILRAAHHRTRAGGALALTGRLLRLSAARVLIEARVGERWRLVTTVRVDDRGQFATPVRLPAAGRYTVRARAGETASAAVTLVASS